MQDNLNVRDIIDNKTTEYPNLKCVVWDTYLQYGIDEAGKVTYSVAEYERGTCNEQLGALYSYDEDRFVFDTVMGGYKPISGTTLSETMDFDSLEQEVNRIKAIYDNMAEYLIVNR